MRERISMLSSDGHTVLKGYLWTPDHGKVKAVVQLVHGMVEYIYRYNEFANYLVEQGYVVVGYDHLGHGASVEKEELYGYFAEHNGHNLLVKDMRKLYNRMKRKYKEIPYFILGHSMGSFLLRRYLLLYGKEGLTGAIIMGTGKQPLPIALLGVGLTKLIKKRKGDKFRSSFINNMAFGGYNRKMKEKRTDKDWLSKDTNKVDLYISHPWCNFIFTVSAYEDLFRTLCSVEKWGNLKRMPKDLSILLISGEADPVGNYGKGVKKLYHQYVSLGLEDVRLTLYKEDRHEILNELDRQQVYEDIQKWIEKRI